VKAAPARAAYRLHAAVVYAAAGMQEAAAKELSDAVRLDPELEKSDEVKALRARLGR
jgi:Tfp pilus assembly protein PilF